MARSRKYAGLMPMTASDLFDLIRKVSKIEDSVKVTGKTKISTYISDSDLNGTKGCLLVSLSDEDASDPAFSNPKQKKRRVVQKEIQEGLEGSGHLIMNFSPVAPQRYRVLIEGTPGLPTTKIQAYLNYLLRVAKRHYPKKFLFPDPEGKVVKGKPVMVSGNVTVALSGHPSDQLIADINAGTMTAVELIKPTVVGKNSWDVNGYVHEKNISVRLDVDGFKRSPSTHFDVIKQIGKKGSNDNVDELRVKFRTVAGLNRSVVLDPATQNTLDTQYIRKELLDGFKEPLGSAYEKVNKELIARLYP